MSPCWQRVFRILVLNVLVHLFIDSIAAENVQPRVDIWNSSMQTLENYINDSSVENFRIRARSTPEANIFFLAKDVPALGWKTFYIREHENAESEIQDSSDSNMHLPRVSFPFVQKFLVWFYKQKRPVLIGSKMISAVELELSDRTFNVTDRETGKYTVANRFVDSGDSGDLYSTLLPLRIVSKIYFT